jgi:hypothetical protein
VRTVLSPVPSELCHIDVWHWQKRIPPIGSVRLIPRLPGSDLSLQLLASSSLSFSAVRPVFTVAAVRTKAAVRIIMSTDLTGGYQQKLDTNVDPRPHPTADSNIARVENKTYNPEHDQRDMRRLGKRQELKVRSFKCIMLGDFID